MITQSAPQEKIPLTAPLGDGYAQINILTESQSVTPLAAPEGTMPIPVRDLLAPPEATDATTNPT